MSEIWRSFQDLFVRALDILHGVFSFLGDEPAWGWSIIALTLIVRIILLPLAIKQTRSMRAMQALQPKIKAIQKKYKADRELLRKDPELYKAKRQKMNEELTALYRESGANPAAGCLPLLAQAPVFFALFLVLRTAPEDATSGTMQRLLASDFYFFTPGAEGLSTPASGAGIAGIALILLMAGSMFWSQRQMLARNAATAEPQQLMQQRIMMYGMPIFLAFISFGFPIGVLLYWVTTNFWQMAQQAVILHEVEQADPGRSDEGKGREEGNGRPSTGGKKTSGAQRPSERKNTTGGGAASRGDGRKSAAGGGKAGNRRAAPSQRDHLPSRRSKGNS